MSLAIKSFTQDTKKHLSMKYSMYISHREHSASKKSFKKKL